MLGRKDYTQDELDQARATVRIQLAAYIKLTKAVDAAADPKVQAALSAFEPLFFNNMTLVLDRFFVHRVRAVTGKEGTPLNEVELLAESLLNNNAVLKGNNVLKYVAQESVTKVEVGDKIKLTGEQFDRLSAAAFGEIEAKFR